MYKNGLIRKISLISKFMMSQTSYQTVAVHILLNISRSKGNQTMKFGQIIEYNMKNIFVEKSYTKYTGETSPRFFSEKSKSSMSLDQYLQFYAVCFCCMTNEMKLQTTYLYLI